MKRRISPARARRVQGQVHAREVLKRRLHGESFPMISQAMHMAVSSVHEAYGRALAEIASNEDIRDARLRALARIDELRARVWKKLDAPHWSRTELIYAALAIERREAELLGLDEFDAGVLAPNSDQIAEQIRTNLTPREQRVLYKLLLKARDGLNRNGHRPAIEVSATPASAPAPEAAPAPDDDPEPERVADFEQYCRERTLHPDDPAATFAFKRARAEWLHWDARRRERLN